MQRDDATLLDVARACRRIVRYVEGMTEDEFSADEKTVEATIRALTVIGEAVNRLSTEFKNAHPEIVWREIIGMRNVLVHEYDDVSEDEVWAAATRDVPELLARLTPMLPESSS